MSRQGTNSRRSWISFQIPFPQMSASSVRCWPCGTSLYDLSYKYFLGLNPTLQQPSDTTIKMQTWCSVLHIFNQHAPRRSFACNKFRANTYYPMSPQKHIKIFFCLFASAGRKHKGFILHKNPMKKTILLYKNIIFVLYWLWKCLILWRRLPNSTGFARIWLREALRNDFIRNSFVGY